MATEVIKIVDPGGGAGYDYLSLNTWEAGMQKDLVTADEISIAKCRSTAGTADTTAVTIDGWTTDATRYIKIWTDPTESYRHNGKWDAGKYRLLAPEYNTAITISESNVLIDGLQIDIQFGSTQGIGMGNYSNLKLSNLIIRGVAGAGIAGIFSDSWTEVKIWNSVIYGFTGGRGISIDGYTANNYIYNNTVYNCNIGIYTAAAILIKNNISYNNTDNYNGTFNAASTNNLSGPTQTDAPGSNPRNGVTVTFVDEAKDDFHLASNDAGARDYGVSDPGSGLFSDDIDGQTRTGIWDIGADEYVAAASLSQSAFRFFNDDGDEDESTPKANENTGITFQKGSNLRLRMQIDASGNPDSGNFELQYRYKPSGGSYESWKKAETN
jgi:hypothetical protein